MIRAINADDLDYVKVTLYYISKHESDIVLRRRLDVLNDRNQITVHMHVLEPSNLYQGFAGPLTIDLCAEAFGIQSDPGVLIRCSNEIQKEVIGILENFYKGDINYKQFNIKKNNVILF